MLVVIYVELHITELVFLLTIAVTYADECLRHLFIPQITLFNYFFCGKAEAGLLNHKSWNTPTCQVFFVLNSHL